MLPVAESAEGGLGRPFLDGNTLLLMGCVQWALGQNQSYRVADKRFSSPPNNDLKINGRIADVPHCPQLRHASTLYILNAHS